MTHDTLTLCVATAGALHFVQIPGMLLTLRALGLAPGVTSLPPLTRRMVQVMGGGIVLCVLGIGLVVVLCAEEIAATRIGTALCTFGVVFWAYRAAAQWSVYRKLWPARAGIWHRALLLLFPVKTLMYAACLVLKLAR